MAIGIFSQNHSTPLYRYHQHRSDRVEIHPDQTIDDKFSTHLPLMKINTDSPIPSAYIIEENGNRERNYESVSATVNYYADENELNSLTKVPDIEENATIRIRGRSSRDYDKKSYLIKFKKSNLTDDKKVSLSGMSAESDWTLHGPFLDKTLIRNYLCYNLAGDIMGNSPNVRFCEMFLNGEYQGLYLITEKVNYSEEGRINLTETGSASTVTSYILQLDVGSEDPLYALNTFNYYTGRNGSRNIKFGNLEIIYPNKSLTIEQKTYIENDISKFEKALVSFDSADRKLGYPSFIDVDSFVDYFIINEFTMNSDAGRLSTYLYKDVRGKMKIAVWDFNSAFNNYIPEMANPHYFMLTEKFWYKYLLRDDYFVDKIVRRYGELRKTYLSDEYLLEYIDETIAYLGPAIDRNYELWGYSFAEENSLLLPIERNPRSYEEAINQLKDIIVERGIYMDENIETLYALSHNSRNKVFRDGTGN